LRERKERTATGLCLVEGAREILMAAAGGYDIESLFFCPAEIEPASDAEKVLTKTAQIARQRFELSPVAFAKVAMREGRDGVIATVRTRTWTWDEVFGGAPADEKKPALILAAQNVEKPGNLGALLRTAEAAGLNALVTLDEAVDVWNPNAIRASLGCAFRVPVLQLSSEEFVRKCRATGLKTVAAALAPGSKPHHDIDMRESVAIVMGAEASGLSPWWLENADVTAVIPMLGEVDSMNVSVAAGIMVFEALRQRRQQQKQ
jgi:TrmH family RNA methyltransferase